MRHLTCIVCPKGCALAVDEETLSVSGHTCPRGEAYGREEVTNPQRVVTSTVVAVGGLYPRCPVKTDRAIPLPLMRDAVDCLRGIVLTCPVALGDVVLENVCGTGANFVATRDL